MHCCIRCCTGTSAWFYSYDHLQSSAVVLLYLQVLCSLIGALGAFYTGLLVANLAVALFGLVAIESGSQNLGRAYAAFLALTLLVDIAWFILFTLETRKGTSFEEFSKFSVYLVFWTQVTSCALRFLSSLLWVQMYLLGVATDISSMYQPVDFEGRIATFGLTQDRLLHDRPPHDRPPHDRPLHAGPPPSHAVSISEEILGGSIYNPSTFASLFQFTDEPYFSSEAQREAAELNGPNMNADSQSAHFLLEKDSQSAGVS